MGENQSIQAAYLMAGVKLSTLITAIGDLSVTLTNGKKLKILDDATLPESAVRLGGVLFPKPDGFISGFTVEPVTYGANGVERMDIRYALTYVFCDISMGSNRSLGDNYTALVKDTVLILNSILTNDDIANGIDLRIADITSFGLVADPAGNFFYGTEIQLNVLEFYEA
jgi:hypothetical protein